MAPLINPRRIIIHHTGSTDGPDCSVPGIRHWHMGTPPNGPADGPYADIAYHLLVERLGDSCELVLGRPWIFQGAHCKGHNQDSLGFAFVGDFNQGEPPLSQLIIGARGVAMLADIFRIPLESICPHRKFNDTDCPGKLFPWEKFLQAVRVAL
ncbi:MAG: peptidoglycan recognition family protein [Acidobacteriota bacterium]